MKTNYSFSILRFIYDPITLEFVNVGVVVYSPEGKQLCAKCTQHYGRISKLFVTFDGVRLRQTLRFIQDQLNDLAAEMCNKLQFRPLGTMHEVLSSVLPIDDSSLQFTKGGVGTTDSLIKATESLFARYVERYAGGPEIPKRGDEDVWRSFRTPFDRKNITPKLVPKKIVARNYEYEFERSWKNGVWHLYEPVSFDLQDANAIADKANRWVGRAMGLEDSKEAFKLFLLLGAPTDERLKAAYLKAENLLNKMPGDPEFIEESEAEEFAKDVAREMESHDRSPA
jgi:hypothetical protein